MTLSWFNRAKQRPDDILPDGWHFFSRPNKVEGPGTIFRIDRDGKRFIVDQLITETQSSPEPGASVTKSASMKTGVIARFLGFEPLSADISAGRSKVVQYEITSPVRILTTDKQIQAVLKPEAMTFLPKNRYFVIREVRMAAALRFALTDEHVGELGGKAVVATGLQAGITLEEKSKGDYELTQTFPEPLYVMFLPEEITVTRAGLAGGPATLGLKEVREVLDWVESAKPPLPPAQRLT